MASEGSIDPSLSPENSGQFERLSDPIEEKPTMRSVGMMMSAPTLVQDPFSAGIGGGKLGIGKPLKLGLPKPLLGSHKKSLDCRTPLEVKQEWSGAASPSLWNVKKEDLELVPLDFPLERTHREIVGTEASIVASRISGALRNLSIDAEYDTKKAKAKCTTSDLVSFRIRLFAGSETGDPVVVEVQRRTGSASSFMMSCRAILNAAEGMTVKETPHRQAPSLTKTPISQMNCLKAAYQCGADAENEAASAMSHSMDMIRSGRRETVILGLENLISLTDPIKTSPLVAVSVSKYVVLGYGDYDAREEMRVLTERDVFAGITGEDEPALQYTEEVRLLVLNLLANALGTCDTSNCLAGAVATDKWFGEFLIPFLVEELKLANIRACSACASTSCLTSLFHCSDTAHEIARRHGVVEALESAHSIGISRHALLASETRRSMDLLSSNGF